MQRHAQLSHPKASVGHTTHTTQHHHQRPCAACAPTRLPPKRGKATYALVRVGTQCQQALGDGHTGVAATREHERREAFVVCGIHIPPVPHKHLHRRHVQPRGGCSRGRREWRGTRRYSRGSRNHRTGTRCWSVGSWRGARGRRRRCCPTGRRRSGRPRHHRLPHHRQCHRRGATGRDKPCERLIARLGPRQQRQQIVKVTVERVSKARRQAGDVSA